MTKDVRPESDHRLEEWAAAHGMEWAPVDPFGLSSMPFLALTSGQYDVAGQVAWGKWRHTEVVVFECLIGRFVAAQMLPPGASLMAIGPETVSLCATVSLPSDIGSLLMVQHNREGRRIAHRARQTHMIAVSSFDEEWQAYADEQIDPADVCRHLRPFLSDREIVEIHAGTLMVRWLDVEMNALEGRLERLMALRAMVSPAS